MTVFLKQSTAIDIRVGPFVDVGDGFVPETGVTIGASDEAEILKANGAATVTMGGTFAAVTGSDGWYDYTLATGDVDTVGELVIVMQDDDVYLPVHVRAYVLEEAVYDALYAASSTVDAYQAKVWLVDDDSGSNDRYLVAFFKNSQPITAGVTVPDLWVHTMAGSTADLVGTTGSPQALTEAGSTETWFHNEGSARIASGTAYMARVQFTADGAVRTWLQPVGRDN